MGYSLLVLFAFFNVVAIVVVSVVHAANVVPFEQNYKVEYGSDHIQYFNNNTEVQLYLDKTSGSGFGSKMKYGSGLFQMKIKLPDKDTTGIITTFYLISNSTSRDEIDFEFLGGNGSYILHTNIFTNGKGEREQQFSFWFDPTVGFHIYTILWNEHLIAFFVDETPIRVFKNKTNLGVDYPSQPLQAQGTIWQGNWSAHGNPVNWTSAPFKANYQGFGIDGCHAQTPNAEECHSPDLFWNGEKFWELDPNQRKAFEDVREKYLNYDYCSDGVKHPNIRLECQYNE